MVPRAASASWAEFKLEVPEPVADEIVRVLRGTTMRGKRVTVRRERDGGDSE